MYSQSPYTMVYGKVIQNIKEKIVLYSTVFCPNTGEYGAKRLVLTVNSQSLLYQHVIFLVRKTDKNFKLERKLKFTQFCNF